MTDSRHAGTDIAEQLGDTSNGGDGNDGAWIGVDVTNSAEQVIVDTKHAHPARMYDYYLGGKDNYEADRIAAREVEKWFPTIRITAQHNRRFMHRSTHYLAAEQGIRQFLDIGTGIPTEPNLHQVAQGVDANARVVYVDNDPVVLSHARALMAGATCFIPADVCHPEQIVSRPELHATLDLAQPVAVSLNALLHFVPDDDTTHRIVSTLLDAVAPGSFLVISHVTADYNDDMHRVTQTYRDSGIPAKARNRDEFARFFDGLTVIDPGITGPHRWKPDIIAIPAITPVSDTAETTGDMDSRVSMYAAVAHATR